MQAQEAEQFADDRSNEECQNSFNSSDKSEEIKNMKMKYKQSQNKVYHDFYKTKICPLYLLSICMKGNECPFAHSEEELREKPNLVKTKLCEAFLQGCCKYGEQCNFAHGEDELRSTPDLFKTAICNLWSQGKCLAGERCRFAHGYDDLRPAPLHHKVKKTQYNQMIKNSSPNSSYVEPSIVMPQYAPNYITMPVYGAYQYYPPQQYPMGQALGMQAAYLPSYPTMTSTNGKAKYSNGVSQGRSRKN